VKRQIISGKLGKGGEHTAVLSKEGCALITKACMWRKKLLGLRGKEMEKSAEGSHLQDREARESSRGRGGRREKGEGHANFSTIIGV